ncbi:MltR family transcriptional regulator [Orbaceae bacterium ac157xtp]
MLDLQEDNILDQLNQHPDVFGVLSTATKLIDQAVDTLILKVFNKEHHAKRFVIPSLIGHNGPLNELSVKLKLLYALSIISHNEYEDIELLTAILDELKQDKHTTYTFIDDEILGPISLLHDMVLPPDLPIKKKPTQEVGIIDNMKSSIYNQRFQQTIRSALIISITTLITGLVEKQNIQYFPDNI